MRRNLKPALLTAFGIALAAGPPALAAAEQYMQPRTAIDAVTVTDFIATCGRNNSLCEYKMRMAVLDKVNTRGATSICLTEVSPQKRVIAWLQAHPETHTMATEDGLYEAYKVLYRCP